MFDADAMFRNFLGHRSIAFVMLESLMIDMPERMEALKAALAGDDGPSAQREVHTIKGLAGNGGAPQVRELAVQIESCCGEGRLQEAQQKLAELGAAVNAVHAEWGAFLARAEG